MSRAFVRESDDRPELPMARQPSPLPPGAKNYLTVDGAERLRRELQILVEKERPELAAVSDDGDAKRRLLSLDQRIQQLEQSLQSAEIVSPPAAEENTVCVSELPWRCDGRTAKWMNTASWAWTRSTLIVAG